MIADELRRQADNFIELDELREVIGRPPREPRPEPMGATELARDWRTDRALRKLEAMMVVADAEITLLLTGQGDVVQPTDGVVGIGSGGPYATSAAKALVRHSNLEAADIVRESLAVAAEIDIYTNDNIILEQLPSTAD